MRYRQPLPRIWLMTDPRSGDPVAAIARLRQRSGIIVRHYRLSPCQRRALFRAILKRAAGKHVVLLAAPPGRAQAWAAHGAHDRSPRRSRGVRTVAVHTARDAALARRLDADLIFVSPVRATQSHPSARPIGPIRAGSIAGGLRRRVIALGGMNARYFSRMAVARFYGWAGIDAFA